MSKRLGERMGIDRETEGNSIVELYPNLQKYCRFLSQNKWDGDDIAQEAILKALRHYRQDLSPALLNKIAYNHWIDTLRKRKNESLEDVLELAQTGQEDKVNAVMEAIDLLKRHFTPKQAVIYTLKEAFQYRANEIAGILETTEMAVKSALHRAKTRLENTKLKQDTRPAEIYWDKETDIQLSSFIYKALKYQDPEILIRAIPSIESLKAGKTTPMLIRSFSRKAPSNALCMAA
ncbi:sigma factor-like helix-turn-helix DNA-binding protein [Bacillus sp. V59.32b]|uniref:sigma factor-like helix-turn-helix DNA-binding protein n=1 Tax=Bacillus sp. V59.32b TaxID=1758642 RepID=UPI0020B176AC|nr:sigma factor-like helix-turn-helix DNA-binding protein [Bacillus sp. V59.32b]